MIFVIERVLDNMAFETVEIENGELYKFTLELDESEYEEYSRNTLVRVYNTPNERLYDIDLVLWKKDEKKRFEFWCFNTDYNVKIVFRYNFSGKIPIFTIYFTNKNATLLVNGYNIHGDDGYQEFEDNSDFRVWLFERLGYQGV